MGKNLHTNIGDFLNESALNEKSLASKGALTAFNDFLELIKKDNVLSIGKVLKDEFKDPYVDLILPSKLISMYPKLKDIECIRMSSAYADKTKDVGINITYKKSKAVFHYIKTLDELYNMIAPFTKINI